MAGIVLTGAPGGGKTTLLLALQQLGFEISHEVAREILKRPGGMELRDTDPLSFANAMFAAHLSEFKKHSITHRPVVFDRGLPDVVGFLDLAGLPTPDALDAACRNFRYIGPIFRAPPWQEIYVRDHERIQTWTEAVENERAVTEAWHRYGYETVDLPLCPPNARAQFVAATVLK